MQFAYNVKQKNNLSYKSCDWLILTVFEKGSDYIQRHSAWIDMTETTRE